MKMDSGVSFLVMIFFIVMALTVVCEALEKDGDYGKMLAKVKVMQAKKIGSMEILATGLPQKLVHKAPEHWQKAQASLLLGDLYQDNKEPGKAILAWKSAKIHAERALKSKRVPEKSRRRSKIEAQSVLKELAKRPSFR